METRSLGPELDRIKSVVSLVVTARRIMLFGHGSDIVDGVPLDAVRLNDMQAISNESEETVISFRYGSDHLLL